MPDSHDQRKREHKAGGDGPAAGKKADRPDPGHVRARRISAERGEVKAHGSAAAAPDGRRAAARPRPASGKESGHAGHSDAERLRRRARFLRERSEAKELRERVQPRRTRSARLRQALRMRTFRW